QSVDALSRGFRSAGSDADLYAARRRHLLLPFALAAWVPPADITVWLLLASLGFWGGLGHWLLILAHRIAPASALAPYIYLGLIWMSTLGFLVFGDVPTLWTLSGAAIVIV